MARDSQITFRKKSFFDNAFIFRVNFINSQNTLIEKL